MTAQTNHTLQFTDTELNIIANSLSRSISEADDNQLVIDEETYEGLEEVFNRVSESLN